MSLHYRYSIDFLVIRDSDEFINVILIIQSISKQIFDLTITVINIIGHMMVHYNSDQDQITRTDQTCVLLCGVSEMSTPIAGAPDSSIAIHGSDP
jgi:hypothetical protein